MKPFLLLLTAICGCFLSAAAETKCAEIPHPSINVQSFLISYFDCTVTRTQSVTITRNDCDGQPVTVTTVGTATATAADCRQANATAYLTAGYNAYLEADAAFLLITWDCQGPPQP